MNKIRNFWQKLPITGKTKLLLLITMAGVLVSAISNAWIVGSSLRSLNRMVSDASACSGALEAVRNETALFDRYIREKGTSNEETFNAACLETQEMVESLPSDYSLIGPERSARLWRVINTYRSYVNARNQIIDLYEKGTKMFPSFMMYMGCSPGYVNIFRTLFKSRWENMPYFMIRRKRPWPGSHI